MPTLHPFSVPTVPVLQETRDVMTLQVYQQSSSVMLRVTTKQSDYVGYIFKIPLPTGESAWLKKQLEVAIHEDSEGVHTSNHELSVFGFGKTVSESIEDFMSSFIDSWEGIKDVPVFKLTDDAIDLRSRFALYFPDDV